MRYSVEHCAIVVLAAGSSSRLGNPKQLLAYKGKSLVRRAVDTALQTGMRPVVVVVGANSSQVKKEMEGRGVEVAENEKWLQGMASSLICGLDAAQKINENIDGIIFMVCDQPFVTRSLLEALLKTQQESGLPIVASSYGENLGTPALFHKTFFPELKELKGDTGARVLIKRHEDQVKPVDFPGGIMDIDTQKDYENLLK